MNQEERFKAKAPHYLKCFIDGCPRHDYCLRWLVGRHANTTDVSIVSVNPMHSDVKAGQCTMFRECTTAPHARGMMGFFEGMTSRQEHDIRQRLIGLFTRKRFYALRKGDELITPRMQQDIARVCQDEGWTGDLQFDGWEEDYLW